MMAGKHSGFTHALFYVGFSLLVCHELDAVARSEWRILPLLNLLDDRQGLIVFVLAHVPLFAGLFWLTGHVNDRIRLRSQIVVDVFLIIHAGLHVSLSGHVHYAFEPPIETITVYGGALFGLLHLFVLSRQRR